MGATSRDDKCACAGRCDADKCACAGRCDAEKRACAASHGADKCKRAASHGAEKCKRGGRTPLGVMARLSVLVAPLSGFMALAVTLGLLGNLAATAVTALGGVAVVGALGLPAGIVLPGATAALVAMAVCALVRGALRYGEQMCNHYIAFRVLALVRDRVFGALRRLAPAKLATRRRGDLVSLVTSDVELLEVFYAHTISPVAIASLFALVMLAFLALVHPALALVAAASYAVVGVAMPLLASRLSGTCGGRFRAAAGELGGYVLDSLRGLDEIQQYGAGEERLREMTRLDDALAADERGLKDAAGWASGATGAAIVLADVALLATGAWLCAAGALSAGDAVVAQLAFMGSFGPFVALSGLGSTLQQTIAAGGRVLDVLDETPACAEVTGRAPLGEVDGMSVRDVSFSYDEGLVLDDVSLEVPCGSVVGVCGRSGSGKSTLLRLMMRFWDVSSGSVEVSGRDVREVNGCDLREAQALVAQDTDVFHDTIRNNVLVGRPDATDEEVEAACRMAALDDFVRGLPHGYDTMVGELGETLSGGERQRLGLARAFLHDAPVMLLDEPTSNLDSLNEGVILRALREGCRDRAVVLVSHRPSTMCVADRVVSCERGRVS